MSFFNNTEIVYFGVGFLSGWLLHAISLKKREQVEEDEENVRTKNKGEP